MYLLIGSYGGAERECISLYRFDMASGDSEFIRGFSGIAEASYQVVPSMLYSQESSRTRGDREVVFYSVSEVNDSQAKLCAFKLLLDEDAMEDALALEAETEVETEAETEAEAETETEAEAEAETETETEAETEAETAKRAAVSVKLSFLNDQKTLGGSPCYIYFDEKRRFAATANYGGANISIFPIAADGSLLPAQVVGYEGGYPDSKRQSYPHPHCIYSSPDGKYLYINDLGCDKIYKYHFLENGAIEFEKEFALPKGEGPRHTVFHPNGRWAYLIGEISGRVTLFEYNSENGDLAQIQSIEADELHAAGSADIKISPDGRFLYASNRLQGDGIAIFKISPDSGLLTKVGYQPTAIHPRNFIISPNGKYLLCACRDSNVVQVFARNPHSGLLQDTGKDILVSKAVCLNLF